MPVVFFILLTVLISCSQGPGEPGKVIEISSSSPGRFCFFGDAGTGKRGQAKIAKLLIKEKCDAYFYLGDIIYPSGIEGPEDPAVDKLFMDHYGPILKKSPMIIMMGNHDYKGNMRAWIEVAKKHENLIYPAPYFRLNYNDLCFLILNTTDRKFAQANWLSGLDLKACEGVVLLGHHPLKSSGKHKNPYFPLNIFLKYAASKAQVYISGHDHQLSYEGVAGGVHQFISGAGGQLRGLDESLPVWGKSQLGYLTYSVDNKNFTFWGLQDDGSKQKLFEKKIDLGALAKD